MKGEGIFVNEQVKRAAERTMRYMADVSRKDQATRNQGVAIPGPSTPGQRVPLDDPAAEARADALADRMMVNQEHLGGAKFRPLEIRVIPLDQRKGGKRFEVIDTSRNSAPIVGQYQSIGNAMKNWPRAIVTPAAKALALELETVLDDRVTGAYGTRKGKGD